MRTKAKKPSRQNLGQTAQERQDEIFRAMSADRKIELGSRLWELAKDLAGDKINYGENRSTTSFSKYSQNS